jgi:hypothetical protein
MCAPPTIAPSATRSWTTTVDIPGRTSTRFRGLWSGGTGRALQAVPPADRDKVVAAAHHAFVTGFNAIALVSVAVAALGSVAGYALVRSRDFVAASGPAAAPPEPGRAAPA